MKLKKHNRYAYSPITERQDFTWPDGKRIAFYCALNVEHFSFGEGLGHTPTAPGPQPDVRNFGWRDYGLRVGICDPGGLEHAALQLDVGVVLLGKKNSGHGCGGLERRNENRHAA